MGNKVPQPLTTNWSVFIDDSCDEKRAEYVCAGSLIGKRGAWNEFNKLWGEALNAPPSIDYFHGKELPRLTGQFAQFRNNRLYPPPSGMDAAILKREELSAVVERSKLVGYGVGVFVPEYTKLRLSHPRGSIFLSADPFEFVLQNLVFEAARAISERQEDVRISFTSDSSNRSKMYRRIFDQWKKHNPRTARFMLDIVHAEDKENYGLQAADMAASSVNRVFRAYGLQNSVPSDYRLSNRFWKISNLDAAYILKVLDSQAQSRVDSWLLAKNTLEV